MIKDQAWIVDCGLGIYSPNTGEVSLLVWESKEVKRVQLAEDQKQVFSVLTISPNSKIKVKITPQKSDEFQWMMSFPGTLNLV